jgi:protein SCO1
VHVIDMDMHKRGPAVALSALTLLFAALTVAFALFKPIVVLPRSDIAPGYSLRDSAGRVVSNETLRGSLVLYHINAEGCTVCEPGATVMRQLAARFATTTPDVTISLVTIDVGPQPALHGDQTGTRVLSGDTKSLKRAVGAGFRVFYETNAGATVIDPALILVDGLGVKRAEYRTPNPDLSDIERDLALLIDETRNSTGWARYAYEAAHLFLCYPS